jgi:hypothetical protein
MAELSMDKFTDTVINAIGPNASPRVREVMTALIRHMNDFAREVKLTTPEYLAACDFVVRIGQISDDKRNEGILASDVFGLESLVDFLDQAASSADVTPSATSEPTSSAILGPFWREHSPTVSRSRTRSSRCGRTHPTGSTSSRTRTSRSTTCAASFGPTRRGATPSVAGARFHTRSRTTVRRAISCR